MALQLIGRMLTVTLVDLGSNRSTLRFFLTQAGAAEAEVDAATIVNSLEAVTDASVRSYQVSGVWDDSEVVSGLGEVENIALITAQIDADEVKYVNLKIPAASAGIFQAASGPLYNEVDPADADLVTYLSHFMTGEECTLSDGETILDPSVAGVVKGKRIHRKSRRG